MLIIPVSLLVYLVLLPYILFILWGGRKKKIPVLEYGAFPGQPACFSFLFLFNAVSTLSDWNWPWWALWSLGWLVL